MTWDSKIENALTFPLRWLAQKALSYNTVNVEWYARNGYPELYALHGGGEPSYSGKTVTRDSALSHSVVWACALTLAQTLGGLPLHLYRRLEGDAKEKATSHPLYRILHDSPNDEMSAFEFREIMMLHAVLEGNAYSRIVRQASGRIVALMPPWNPAAVTPRRGSGGKIVYDIRSNDGTTESVPSSEVFHIRGLGFDGIRGYSVVTMARNSIGNALAAEEYTGKFYASGGRVPYLLKHPGRFAKTEDFEKFREQWENVYREPHRAPILEGGLEYQQIGIKPEDSQFLETRQFNVPEICRWFLMRPHMVGDLSRATDNNIEHQGIEAQQYTFMPWCKRWEGSNYRCLLGSTERGRYFSEFNMAGLARGDMKARGEFFGKMRTNGIYTGNEIRAKENMNPVAGGDTLLVQGAMIPVDQAGQGGQDAGQKSLPTRD